LSILSRKIAAENPGGYPGAIFNDKEGERMFAQNARKHAVRGDMFLWHENSSKQFRRRTGKCGASGVLNNASFEGVK
jgi:hypothetical protein